MTEILYTSSEVRSAIWKLFSSSKGRRIVITAFVGEGAEKFLPKPDGVRLICWPKEGSTNSQALRRLMGCGVKVEFCDNVHMKVYWSEERGAVIASANLSTAALGGGVQREIGVLFPPNVVDIDVILSSLHVRAVSGKELSMLDSSDSPYGTGSRIRGKSLIDTFGEWWGLPNRKKWKLGWWNVPGGTVCTAAKDRLRECRRTEPGDILYARRAEYVRKDWVLAFKLGKRGPTQLHWMYVDFVVEVLRSDSGYDSRYPLQAVQAEPFSVYSGRPFSIDNRFIRAFTKAVSEFGAKRIEKLKSLRPPWRLLSSIYENYSRKGIGV